MGKEENSTPLSLRKIQVTDTFWKNEMELVRKEVIPYQWEILNDRIPEANPSFCVHNFQVAKKMNQKKKELGKEYKEPEYTFRGFEALPEDPDHLKDEFYGFVFQDSDIYKWLEAVAYSLTQHPDKELEKIADDAIALICDAQQEDGYLDTYYIINGKDRIFTNLRDHHELYCFGHLTEAAVAYYQATGKTQLLNASKRFADFIIKHCKGYPGHEIAEMALVRLYDVTKEEKYLELSKFFINHRGEKPYYFLTEDHSQDTGDKTVEERYQYYQAHLPVREQTEAVGHAVRAVYLYSGMADIARITKDQVLYQACKKLWDSITERKLYITGGIGATHIGEAFSFDYDLPNDTVYAETCASIGLMFFARRMLEIKADAKYANVMERALYNTVLSGIALDGKSFFYVNPLEVLPEACHKDERKAHVKPVRQKWFGCACCPPNVARLLSSLGAYAYTETEQTIFVHMYVGGEIEKQFANKTAKISMQSNMPWESDVCLNVDAENTNLCIALRIPDWADGYQLEQAKEYQLEEKDGYLYITKEWKKQEQIQIHFQMQVRIVEAKEAVREDIGKVAIQRGPFVYCMEAVDNGEQLHLLSLDPDTDFQIEKIQICDRVVDCIKAKGLRKKQAVQSGELYRTYQKPEQEEVTLTFVPYYVWGNRKENEMQTWIRVGSWK